MLEIEAQLEDGTCRLRATNSGRQAVHVFDWDRMPYLLPDGGGLLVLHGMHEPPPEDDYYGIEIPSTRPLGPGEVLAGEVCVVPPVLHGHYTSGDPIVGLADSILIRTAVGWGTTPLDDRALVEMSLGMVCRQWQQVTEGPMLTVTP